MLHIWHVDQIGHISTVLGFYKQTHNILISVLIHIQLNNIVGFFIKYILLIMLLLLSHFFPFGPSTRSSHSL